METCQNREMGSKSRQKPTGTLISVCGFDGRRWFFLFFLRKSAQRGTESYKGKIH